MEIRLPMAEVGLNRIFMPAPRGSEGDPSFFIIPVRAGAFGCGVAGARYNRGRARRVQRSVLRRVTCVGGYGAIGEQFIQNRDIPAIRFHKINAQGRQGEV